MTKQTRAVPTITMILIGTLAHAAPERDDKPANEDDGPIKLQSIFVGDKEQPAISYFIPWQGVGAPDELDWNVERKHDEVLKPVDRNVMLRSIRLYESLQLDAPIGRR